MTTRYLFGPVTAAFADQNLRGPRAAGQCLAFNADGSADLAIAPTDTWEAVAARLPSGWVPGFTALWLPYTHVPACLWSAPVPLVGLAADWNLLWHHYRRLPCDRFLTDLAGVEAFAAAGRRAKPANLFGCEPAFLDGPYPEGPRDLDVLFVGNLHPAVQRERLPWLGRLARLGGRWKVALHTGVFGDDYRALLGRARVVFNRSVRGECNRRAFEAAAAGALLFQEAGNRETPAYFRDRQECVSYTEDDLEELLEHYLTHEDERRALAEAACERVRHYSFETLWAEQVAGIERDADALQESMRRRLAGLPADDLLGRCWQAASGGADPRLADDLAAALAARPDAAGELHNALGVAVVPSAHGRGPLPRAALERAAGCFKEAVGTDPHNLTAGLNRAEALLALGQNAAAVQQARQTLARLDREAVAVPAWLDAPLFPPGYGWLRVEWEQAAWAHACRPHAEADAKRSLLRWRLHALLAEATGDLAHHYEAVAARPDLPTSRLGLGQALAHGKRPAEAVSHLRQASAANPFDREAARALFDALGAAGDTAGQRRLARNRRLLAQTAPKAVPAEPWFTEAPPVGDELASLIILCCNEAEYTRQCLESVLRHTRPPYELVLVDNGSTDDTPKLLEEVRSRPGPDRVVVIHNEANRGFPAGCNQGLAEARGDYLVFLNNDTVVTAGWLDGLVAWALHDWPTVGLVGAVTNYSRPPQQIACDYDALDGLAAFAARRGREYVGKAMQVDRLTGFCLLARRAVLDRVGGYDERYELGFFDDDDLCVRARQAGFRLLVALNVFVHHFGSRTFVGLGIDCREQLQANFDRFRAKWGDAHAAGYRLPESVAPAPPAVTVQSEAVSPDLGGTIAAETAPLPTVVLPAAASSGRPLVSLTMIVKNEEANLPACLGSVADLVDEIIVVDTGSADKTKEIAVRFGVKVFDFPWVDSFAAARNEALRHATGDWVFWMDADDRLDEANRAKLRALLAGLREENVAYSMKCACLPDPATGAVTVVDHIRLFRNDPQLRWRYRVHEQILPAVRQVGGDVRWADVVIHHTGYQDAELRGRKLDRDLRLLRLEDAEHPDDPFTLFNLGASYHELRRPAEALPLLRRSLARSCPRDSIVRKLYALIAQCHRQLGQGTEALQACAEGRRHYPEDAELLFQEALVRRERADLVGAEQCLLRLLEGRDGAHFASVDAGLRGHKARHNLAVVYREQGRDADAVVQWRAALAEVPQFTPAWLGLGEVLLGQRHWTELEEVCRGLEACGGEAAGEATALRARGHLARKEFTPARQLLEKAIAAAPQAVRPRVLLTHVLLQEGRDWDAAEKALRAVLALDPQHAEARRNLAILLRDQGRAAGDAGTGAVVTLEELYQAACMTPSDIHKHCPTLYALAKECRHVTEMGTRTAVSTAALLFAQPERLVCYDLRKYPQVDRLAGLAGRTQFVFHEADVRRVEIEETDLLFIDTWHVYEQLQEELFLHADKVRKYIVLHDTTTFGEQGETEGRLGLWPAVEEFLVLGTFRLKQRYTNNNGLTVLERARPAAPPLSLYQPLA